MGLGPYLRTVIAAEWAWDLYLIEPELRVWSLSRQEMAVTVLEAKVGE